MGAPVAAASGKIPSPNPDLGVPDAYTKLTPPFPKSVPMIPGKGGKVTAFLINYDPPVPPKSDNLYWQELEKRLGVTYDATMVDSSGYEQKFAATLAGGDIPDLTFFSPPPGYEKILLQGAFTDLTEYLTGSALKDYPNLAAFPSVLWKNVALNKKIYGVPRPRLLGSNSFYFRQDWAEKTGHGVQKNADDVFDMFVKMAKNNPDGKKDAYGLSASSPRPQFAVDILCQMFRAPNTWRLNGDGSLTHTWESDEYKQAIAYTRRLWEAGAFHPDTATNGTQQNKDLFYSSRIGAYNDGFPGLFGSGGARGQTRKLSAPNSNVTSWVPPGFDGGKGVYHKAIGYFGFTAIPAKVGKDKERVKELLRVLNWLAAPIGSEENTFTAYGIEGTHFTFKDALPVKNDRGRAEIGVVSGGAQGIVLASLTNPPQVALYDQAGDAEEAQQVQAKLLANGIENAVWGYYSQTNSQQGALLAQLQGDALASVITGREQLGYWDTFLKDWRSRGGDQARKEFQDSIKSS